MNTNTLLAVVAFLAVVAGGYYLWTHRGDGQSPYAPPPPPPPPPPPAHRSNVADVIIAGFNNAAGVIGALR